MLSPQSNRLDYGEHLQPPDGYELDCAIATTYSLDLDALLAVPVAVCFHDTLEGDLRGEKLALLEAIGQLKGRIKVFYQAGKIKLPPTYNRLFALLEPCLQPILPEGGVYSSFHPKLWLLRYVAQDGLMVKYRLLVLSRNLTFDRSWDIAVSLDGELVDKPQRIEKPWIEFVYRLLDQTTDFAAGDPIKAELEWIKWQAPDGFWDPRILPGGPSFGPPVELLSPNDSLLVISPFLKDAGGFVKSLDELSEYCPDGNRWLFSRSEELNSIGEEKLRDWICFSINEDVVDGEERLQLSEHKQNLHAKLIINQRGQTTHWHIGSANATSAALGDIKTSDPRNSELMLRLTGRTQTVGPECMLGQWIGDDDNPSLFVAHQFVEVEHDENADLRNSIRQAVHQLIHANWEVIATLDEQGTYHLQVTCDLIFEIPVDLRIEVGQLAINNAYQPLAGLIEWKSLSLSQVSALVPIRIMPVDKDSKDGILEHLVIQASLKLPEGANREQSILSELVNTESKFLNYIRLLLQRHPDKNEWLGYDNQEKHSEGLYLLFDDSPLFEQLMEAAATHPESLQRISKMLQRIKDAGVPMPESFQKLWPHFESIVR